MSTAPDLPRPAASISPMQAFAFLWRGRWIIAGAVAAAVAAGSYYADQRGTIWRARSVLYVERESPLLPGKDVSLWLESRNYAHTQAALLRSTPILEQGLLTMPSSAIFGDATNHLAWLQRHLQISVGTQDDLITVALDSPNVDDACVLVNAVVDSYLDFHSRNKRTTASVVLTNLTAELARYEKQLQDAEREQVEFLRANPGVGPSQEWRLMAADRIRELNNALTRADLEVIEAEAEWKTAKSMASSSELLRQMPFGRGQAAAPNPAAGVVTELEERRLRMLAEVTPDHPEVRRLDTLIANLRAQRHDVDEQFANATVALLEHRLQGARDKVQRLRTQLHEEERRSLDVNPAQAQYQAIELRYERTRKITDLLYDRVNSIDINERLGSDKKVELDAMVYERAAVESAAVAASKRSMVAIAGFVGLVLGTGLAWLRALLDQRVRSAAEIGEVLPVLAAVPTMTVVGPPSERLRRQPDAAAALRSLHAMVRYGSGDAPARVLQLVAPMASANEPTIVAGLGIAMAQAGERVLIVDAAQRGDQARLLGVENPGPGLARVSAGSSNAREAIVATAVPGLMLLPATARPGEPLQDKSFVAALTELGRDFDRILVDSPPLLSDPDARIVAAVCDGTLLLVRAGQSTRPQLRAAANVLLAVGGRLAGAVMTRAPRRSVALAGAPPPVVMPRPPAGRSPQLRPAPVDTRDARQRSVP